MGLFRGSEVTLDPYVELPTLELEPDAPALGQVGRFRDLGETEELSEETAGELIGARGGGEQDVVEP